MGFFLLWSQLVCKAESAQPQAESTFALVAQWETLSPDPALSKPI